MHTQQLELYKTPDTLEKKINHIILYLFVNFRSLVIAAIVYPAKQVFVKRQYINLNNV